MILAQVIDFVLDEKRVHKLRKEQSQCDIPDIPKEEVNRSNSRNNRVLRTRNPLLSSQIMTASGGQKGVMTASGEQIMNSRPQEDGSKMSAGESQAHGSPAETGDFQLDPDARVFTNPVFPTESVATAIFTDPLVVPAEDEEKEYVVTFLDHRAAFDSVSHKVLDVALREAGCTSKTRAIFRGSYQSASTLVRAKMPGDESEATSKPLDVRRGVAQGDIVSPVCFIIALECLTRQ